jgi:glycosyltransferase involved in cell wall biosynthesis
MRVIQVIDTLAIGGGEQVLVDITKILANREVDVDVLCLTKLGSKSEELKGICDVTSLSRTSKFSIVKMYQLYNRLKQYDIIHCHFRHVFRYVKLVGKIFSLKGNVILHDHYGKIDVNKKIPFGFNLMKVENYIGVSETLTKWSQKNLNPVNNLLLPNIIIKSNNTQKLDRRFEFICIGNIKPTKNQMFAAKIAKNLNNSILFIGAQQDINYTKELVTFCNEMKLDYLILSNIKCAQDYIKNANVALHTAVTETGPLVLIEYMAHQLPFLCYNTGEVAKNLLKELPELVLNSFEVEDWLSYYQSLKNNKAIDEKLSSIFNSNYSEESYFTSLIDFYEKILNE